ncbi:hypothetical protein NQ317_001553 [Molorchus minor]|uniref:SMP-LTD domain-containing protein n=1 Tax=Molorchus minor TaxID=1323400 RepID=A0ABQ9J2E7_9CUCU|nr:hypothetical protein NQ317_001553 [Molorchus minor]
MNKKKDHGKITLGMLKGKPVTTSVPSISIKFHANAEQIEELYASEDETSTNSSKADKSPASTSVSTVGEPDSSPLRYLPRLVKRSTSVDVSQPPHNLDASPPSDPWRFFSDIKGKITKSVEEKITEIKSRNQEEGSPHHKGKPDLKTIKDSKENSSVSDSEDLSESSISKTCGIVSTTEEMSSDDETPSLDKDKKDDKLLGSSPPSSTGGLSHRFRLFKNKNLVKESPVKIKDLSKLYNINTEKADQTLPEDSEDVESAVDALEESDNMKSEIKKPASSEEVVKLVSQKIDNIEPGNDNVINLREGGDLKTVFAPTGFVDFRPAPKEERPFSNYMSLVVICASILLYVMIHHYSPFLAGLAIGIILTYIFTQIYLRIYPLNVILPATSPENSTFSNKLLLEIQAIKEYQPGWANELPEVYNAYTYHISKTQSVYLRLQGNLLRISHSRSKVPKRAMWDEQEIKHNFTHHRIYNLLGAKISNGAKKYPICITLSKEQMNLNPEAMIKIEPEEDKEKQVVDKCSSEKEKSKSSREKRGFTRFRKKEYQYPILAQRFSKLTEDEEFELESDSRASTPSAEISDAAVEDSLPVPGDEDLLPTTNEQNEDDVNSLADDWSMCSGHQSESPDGKKSIYLVELIEKKKTATHMGIGVLSTDLENSDVKDNVSEILTEAAKTELEYIKYMSFFKPSKKLPKPTKEPSKKAEPDRPEEKEDDSKSELLLWLNAFIGRVLFDCVRDPAFIMKVRERIQRKLYTIKLPYFIEEILIPEMSLGKTPPFIHKTSKPVLDDRGLWVDLDVTYEGMIVLTLQTKLNLMRLKNPQAYEKSSKLEKSAMYHSDVDDSAESSSDEEGTQDMPNISQDSSTPAQSSTGNSGKRFIKMVDKIAESKIFQYATEYRVIQKAMEGVSNTDLRLTVEVKAIMGTLVLNIPPPPSDRVWIGFRPVPEIVLSARPIVGERNISYIIVTRWIEKKLLKEFQKIMVIPNMEDFVIPVMNPKLPE